MKFKSGDIITFERSFRWPRYIIKIDKNYYTYIHEVFGPSSGFNVNLLNGIVYTDVFRNSD